jgi:geranylgeranylglycerol-phosphate geranylgeranyltransferase
MGSLPRFDSRRWWSQSVAFLDLFRGHHALWFGGLTFLGLVLRGERRSLAAPLCAGLAMASLAAGGYALNDCYDLEVDRVNAPRRPLPSGRLRHAAALRASVAAFAVGVVLSAALGPACLLVASVDVAVLVLYARTSKRLGWLKTAAVCWLLGSIFVFASCVLRRFDALLALGGLYAVFRNFYSECVKDLHDLHGDSLSRGARTPAMLMKEGRLLALARAALAAAVCVGCAVYLLGFGNGRLPVLVALVGAALYQASREKDSVLSKRWLTAACFVELAAILVGCSHWPPLSEFWN